MSTDDDLPAEVKERAEAIKEENPDLSESEAIAIARDQLNLAADDDCPDGHARVGDECVPIPEGVESVDAPPSVLSSPQHLTLKSLDTEPIERVEESGDRVRYKSLKLLSPGVWSDAGSQTATYYPPEGIAALEPDYDESEHDGPPVNIMHDLDMDTFEAHDASVAGHVDPDTLDTDDDGNLYGDIVFDTSTGAGQFADENLQSTLENEGTVGFGGPSVEIPAEGLQQEHDPARDMPRVDGGLLSGVAMVMDPASKSVNFAREAARRPVAMAAGSKDAKAFTLESETMSPEKTLADPDDIRSELEQYNVDTEDMSDEDVLEFAEALHADLMDALEDGGDDEEEEEGDGIENEDDDKPPEEDEEEDEDDDTEMQGDDIEMVMERVQNLASRLEDVEDAVSQAMTADDVESELADAKGSELAAADTVEEVEKTLAETRETVEAIAEEPTEGKTMADADNSDIDWSDADGGVSYDPATGSMSR